MFKLAQGETDEHGLGLTPVGYSFVAGMLRHLPAITAVTAPTVNSYKVRAQQNPLRIRLPPARPTPFVWLVE
jgi:glutamine synthetase